MSKLDWDITELRAYKSLSSDEAHVLWSTELPPTREHDPALWDLQMGFFEDAIVDVSRQPGNLVVTPVSYRPSIAFPAYFFWRSSKVLTFCILCPCFQCKCGCSASF